jgi:hypothetical protein
MGIEIDRIEFEERDHAAFAQRLGRSLEALEQLLSTPGFGVGERSIGAELEVSLIDGDARAFEDGQRDLGLVGSRSFAEAMRQEGIFERLRVAIFFASVADADLTIARDLASNRALREVFWDEAVELGEEKAFSRQAGMSSVRAGVSVFEESGFRRSVVIADDRYGGNTAPGLYRHTRDDTSERCSDESLDVVGRVAQAALERITRRLRNIDVFAASPLRGDLGARNSWP